MAERRRRLRAAVGVAALLLATGTSLAGPAEAAGLSAAQVRSNQWWLQELNIEKAWPASNYGAGVTVGVIDSGVDGQNQDLSGAVVGGQDFSGGKGSSNGQQGIGSEGEGSTGAYHGTAMAAFIAGRGHGPGNGLGIIGAAPKASILTASVEFGGNDNQQQFDTALRWLVDKGAKVVNMSFGGVEIDRKTVAYAQSHDVVLVGAAGNDGGPPNVPANYLGVVDVAGLDKNLQADPDSSHGGPTIAGGNLLPASDSANGIAVAGPYGDTYDDTADDQTFDPSSPHGLVQVSSRTGYSRGGGTSSAAAVVSGIVALIRAAHPTMDANNVVNQLGQFAKHPGGVPGQYTPELGFGVPNAYNSVTMLKPTVCENPFGSLIGQGSFGLWKSIDSGGKVPYKPSCTNTPSTSPSSSQTSPSNDGSSTNAALPPSSDTSSSSGVPVWVWPVVAVVVLGVIGGVIATRRARRPAAGGPPQPPSN